MSDPPPPPEPLDEFNEAWKDLRPATLEAMGRKDLAKFVMAMCDGQVFTTDHIKGGPEQIASLAPMIFLPLALGGLESIPERDRAELGIVYEYMDKAVPTSINGYPIFFSMRLMIKADWEKALTAYHKEMDRRKTLTEDLFEDEPDDQ